MKYLITDAVYSDIAEELEKFMDVKVSDGKPPSKEETIREIAGTDVLIMRVDSEIDRDILDIVRNLKVINVCAADLSHIDLEYMKGKGTQVFNAPGLSVSAVAELTTSKVLDISRHTILASQDVKVDHIWDKCKYAGRELRGRALDVMGFGRIDRRVAEFAKTFGVTIVAYNLFLEPEDLECRGAEGIGVDELIKVSGFISLHIPLTPETENLSDKRPVAEMRGGAVVLNTNRSGIVSEQNIYEALCADRIGGYATDAMENELAGNGLNSNDEFQNPFFSCGSFVINPYIGAQVVDASGDVGLHIVKGVKEVMNLK